MAKKFKITLLLVGILLSVPELNAQDPFDPQAAQVLDQNIAAVFSPKAAAAIENIAFTSEGTYSGSNFKISIKSYAKKGGKLLLVSKTSAPGINLEMKQGCDGSDCYSSDQMLGLRKLEGQEQEMLFLTDVFAEWRSIYVRANYLGTEKTRGIVADKIMLESEDGIKQTSYFDVKTHLLLRSELTAQTEMGTISQVWEFFGYIEKDGYTFAEKTITATMGKMLEMKIEMVEINGKMPDSLFKLPPGLKP